MITINFLLQCILYVFLFFPFHLPAQNLIEYRLAAQFTTDSLKKFCAEKNIPTLVFEIDNDVDVYEILYRSSWHDSTPVTVSGVYFQPKTGESLPLLCYHHGTQTEKERQIALHGELLICTGFAAAGYAVAYPDYLGLGKGEKTHLYLHAETEAQTTIDMIRAVKELNARLQRTLNEQLFLTGYSQGGHATMAAHKIIQERYAGEFRVTASAPMSGPYNLIGAQAESMFAEYAHPGYLPYLLLSYQEVYAIGGKNIYQLFKSPYDSVAATMYNGKYRMREIDRKLPAVPQDMLRDEWVAAFQNDPENLLAKALRDNSVYDWKPESPMLICYCRADEQVSYKNALLAYRTMKANGSNTVKLRHAGKKYRHNTCVLYTTAYAKLFFDTFRKGGEKGGKGSVFKRALIGLSKLKVKG